MQSAIGVPGNPRVGLLAPAIPVRRTKVRLQRASGQQAVVQAEQTFMHLFAELSLLLQLELYHTDLYQQLFTSCHHATT